MATTLCLSYIILRPVITGPNVIAINQLLKCAGNRFSLLGDLDYFLGIEATAQHKASFSRYILDILDRFHMLEANLVSTPMASSNNLGHGDGTTIFILIGVETRMIGALLVARSFSWVAIVSLGPPTSNLP